MPVLKRVIFADRSSGGLRFHNMNLVMTSRGAMVEVGSPLRPNSAVPYDPTDAVARVDDIILCDLSMRDQMINNGETILIHSGAYQNQP